MILVTGATGNVGSAAIAELAAKGIPVRAFVRDAKRAERLAGELFIGDFDDASSISRAMDGVDVVVLSSADHPGKVQQESAVIDAAAAAGVRRIVKVSTGYADPASPMPPLAWHGQIEEHLRASGVPAVYLHSYFYMTNLLASAEPIAGMGKLFAPLAGAKIAMIDPRDTGAVAAAVSTSDDYDGQTLDLSGGEAVTYEQVADELSVAIGRAIEFVPIPDEAARETFVGMGLPDWLIAHFEHLFPLLRSGAFAQPTDTVRAVAGREPTSFAAWAKDHARVFGA